MDPFFREYFDEPIDRRGTGAIKWDALEDHFGARDLLPAWVADMDFRTVPEIPKAIADRAAHAVYGYTDMTGEMREAEAGWLKRRHSLEVRPEWILSSPGVVDSVHFCVRAFTEKGDGILFQTPSYGPFHRAVEMFERREVTSPLLETPEGWRMDFEDLEKKLPTVRMMILCSPHNPVGRVWTAEELTRLVDLCSCHDVILVSDEIHADFVFDGREHRRILSIPGAEKCVMLSSATKSFNLAGLRCSSCVIPDPGLREAFRTELDKAHAGTPNLFAAIAQTTAYTCGDAWMDALKEYLCENRDRSVAFFREKLPAVAARPQEGTYLMWLDLRAFGRPHRELEERLIRKARVALNSGLDFGPCGEGFFRLNLASPAAHIDEVLERIRSAFEGL